METIQGSEPQMRVPGVAYPVTVLGYPATLIDPKATYESVSEQIGGIALNHPRNGYGWRHSVFRSCSF